MKFEELSRKFRMYFKIPSSPVAVKIIKKDTDYGSYLKFLPKTEMRYCDMVRKASLGEKFACTSENMLCANADLSLGFESPFLGDLYPVIKPAETACVLVFPLEDADFTPDLVLAVLTPKKAMDLVTAFKFVTKKGMTLFSSGERAVCGEVTALPYMEKRINITFLCDGARLFSNYRDSEIVYGAPFELFENMITSLKESVVMGGGLCGCIMDDIPETVKNALAKIGFVKAADHFYKIDKNKVIKLGLNKDMDGKIVNVSIYLIKNSRTKI
jgi:uncharacterized protein (DUF169 family)